METTDTIPTTQIERLIEKYTPRIQEGLGEMKEQLGEMGGDIYDLAIRYAFFQDVSHLIFSSLALVLSILLFKKLSRTSKKDYSEGIVWLAKWMSAFLTLLLVVSVIKYLYYLCMTIWLPEIRVLKLVLEFTSSQ